MSTATKTNPRLWKRIVEKVKAGSRGGDTGEWSARKAQLAVASYKKSGGGYQGKKSGSNSLSKWTKQNWTTSSGKPSNGKLRYLPKRAWESLSPEEKRATNQAKKEGDKKGSQYVPQPKKVAEKVKKYRK